MDRSELIAGTPLVHARVTGTVGVIERSFAGFVGSRLLVRGDVIATARNVLASAQLFRLGILSSLIMVVVWIFYALLLYRLLRPVNKSYALAMFALVLVSAPIYMLNQVNQFAALPLAADQQYEQLELFLELQRLGTLIAAIFFGLWLFPLGLLVFKSGFFPRFLGILLMVGTLGYLVLFVQAFLFSGSERTLWTNPFLVVTLVAELSMMLWLLIRGVNVRQWEQRCGLVAAHGGIS